MKDSSLKNNNLIRILYRTDNSSTPILNIMPSKGFLGLNYILLHNLWSTTVISMRFYIYSDAVLEYGSPLSAADYLVSTSNCHAYTGREIIPKSFFFPFLEVKNSVSTAFKRDWYILVFSHKFKLFVMWCLLFSHDLFIFLNNANYTSTCNYFWKNTMNYLKVIHSHCKPLSASPMENKEIQIIPNI